MRPRRPVPPWPIALRDGSFKLTGIIARRAFCKQRTPPFWLAGVLWLGLAVQSLAQPVDAVSPPQAELLNSERIAQEFGSYGIAVLESDETIRVSNLYSMDGDRRTCRTFAVVRYPAHVDPMFSAEHQLILDGGSIGAVFAARNWAVEKSHRYYGEVRATDKLAELMGTVSGASLAVHLYVLEVSKSGTRLEYATIVEVHHPDYLTLKDLPAIYGPLAVGQTDQTTAEMLEIATDKMRR